MQTSNLKSNISRSLIMATALGAPLILGGCVVDPNPYYAAPAYATPAPGPVYAAPEPYYYAAPAYVGPSVYIGGGGCCWGRGGGWRR